eukprot:CAMPEP_0117441150 /NCGR_PEP_ID=MMETSP0759-20121206/3484_1 /TAXON_ID=63605 /ORGANISM="Percolomonas cosmopolitus, Strain WS" /LENGTH=776 /DNA_ID=CAMNT_0005232991 /DNA_START=2270 /DNA_END=4600 /DNA_ORIENTATION=-
MSMQSDAVPTGDPFERASGMGDSSTHRQHHQPTRKNDTFSQPAEPDSHPRASSTIAKFSNSVQQNSESSATTFTADQSQPASSSKKRKNNPISQHSLSRNNAVALEFNPASTAQSFSRLHNSTLGATGRNLAQNYTTTLPPRLNAISGVEQTNDPSQHLVRDSFHQSRPHTGNECTSSEDRHNLVFGMNHEARVWDIFSGQLHNEQYAPAGVNLGGVQESKEGIATRKDGPPTRESSPSHRKTKRQDFSRQVFEFTFEEDYASSEDDGSIAFSPRELARLRKGHEKYSAQWGVIHREFEFSPPILPKHLRLAWIHRTRGNDSAQISHLSGSRNPWTTANKRALTTAVNEYGENLWEVVSQKSLPHFSPEALSERWNYMTLTGQVSRVANSPRDPYSNTASSTQKQQRARLKNSTVGSQSQKKPKRKKISQELLNEKCCATCTVTETPLWRYADNKKLCNKCGIYFQRNGSHRPPDLRKRKRHGVKSQGNTTPVPMSTTEEGLSPPKRQKTAAGQVKKREMQAEESQLPRQIYGAFVDGQELPNHLLQYQQHGSSVYHSHSSVHTRTSNGSPPFGAPPYSTVIPNYSVPPPTDPHHVHTITHYRSAHSSFQYSHPQKQQVQRNAAPLLPSFEEFSSRINKEQINDYTNLDAVSIDSSYTRSMSGPNSPQDSATASPVFRNPMNKSSAGVGQQTQQFHQHTYHNTAQLQGDQTAILMQQQRLRNGLHSGHGSSFGVRGSGREMQDFPSSLSVNDTPPVNGMPSGSASYPKYGYITYAI